MAAIDLVDWPAERMLRVTGSPASLRLPITLSNSSDTIQGGGAPAHIELKSAAGHALSVQSVGTLPAVAAGSVAPGRLRLRLDPTTPPGSYQGQITVAGVTRPLQIDIVETVAVAIRPAPLVIDAANGATQPVSVSVENRGNVALTVDLTGDYPLGEELPLLSPTVEDIGAANGIEKLIGLLQPAAHRMPPLREIGRIHVTMPGGPVGIEPGAAATVALALALPDLIVPSVRYRAFIPLYDGDLAIVIVTAAKSKSPGRTSRPRSKGVTK